MSIAEALGYTDEQLLFSKIPEERIKHIGKDNGEKIETSCDDIQIFAENEEDRKVLRQAYGLE